MTLSTPSPRLGRTAWLVLIVASIGFLFDTYELLMTPLVAPSALAELLKVPPNNPLVTQWVGKILWFSALSGGVFGLAGGWLIDRLGRKSVMVGSLFVYSFSPLLAAYSTSVEAFVFFRCTTFIGVCVEFIAAITWMAELFDDPKQRERCLGITQAFASLGGVAVTTIYLWIQTHPALLPSLGLPLPGGGTAPGNWRYLLLTGLIPAIPIALLLPFVPESRVWRERRAAGTLHRPSFGALFTPALRRVTLVTAILSACAYAIAFGALQVTVSRVTPGLPELAGPGKVLAPLRKAGMALNQQLNQTTDGTERAALLAQIKKNFGQQKPLNDQVQKVSSHVQFFQEMGGLAGRVALALLIVAGLSRRGILRLLQIPALIVLPLTYFYLFAKGGDAFFWAYAACGFFTVAQFSYFGEYLPRVFPIHLRGTGGSFATNVGGRMVGTSASFLTTVVLAPLFAGNANAVKPADIAHAAGWVATGVALIALIVGFFLPEPAPEAMEPAAEGAKAAVQNPGVTPAA